MDITQIKNKILSFADEGEKWIKSLAQEVYNNPEGGFTDYEVSRLLETGARGGTLGSRILRTEVALPALLGKFL